MQTSLFIEKLPVEVATPTAGPGALRRALAACHHWFTSYELGTDEKIRRFTGAR